MKHLFICLFLLSFFKGYSQGNAGETKHVVFAEAGGKGLYYSLNYEYFFRAKPNSIARISSRIGFGMIGSKYPAGYYGVGNSLYQIIYYSSIQSAIPYALNINFGKKTHFLELGVGQTLFLLSNYYSDRINITNKNFSTLKYSTVLVNNFSVGYKRTPLNGGFFYSAQIMLFFAPITIDNSDITYTYESRVVGRNNSSPNNLVSYFPIIPFAGFSFGYAFTSK